VVAFFLAVGVAAHALDELHGRPLRTAIPGWALITATVISLAGAVGLGIYGITQTGWILLPFMVAGPVLVVAYNAELFGGIIHNDLGFAAAWGAFPALTGYAAQDGTLGVAAVAGAAAALALSAAQRRLSTPARSLRRRAVRVEGTITLADGTVNPIGPDVILAPLEGALRAMSWGLILLATAMAVARLG
jgi:voltage-gated potassium channel Kch